MVFIYWFIIFISLPFYFANSLEDIITIHNWIISFWWVSIIGVCGARKKMMPYLNQKISISWRIGDDAIETIMIIRDDDSVNCKMKNW